MVAGESVKVTLGPLPAYGGNLPQPSAPPVALDLDGHGVGTVTLIAW